MDEKRKFSRCDLSEKTHLSLKDRKEDVEIQDLSTGGMRVVTKHALDKEESFSGEFKVLSNIAPFFVKGKVIWSTQKGNIFESGLAFSKVSTIPLAA